MEAYLKRFLQTFKSNDPFDCIKEAIVNSLHAGADRIEIFLDKKSIRVIDNGQGFLKENIDAFSVLYTPHKEKKGGKGVGRICYLKHFGKIKVDSFFKEEGVFKKVHFTFTNSFKKDEIKSETVPNKKAQEGNKTEFTFLDPKETTFFDNFSAKKNVDKLNYVEKLKTDVLLPLAYAQKFLTKNDFIFTVYSDGKEVLPIDSKKLEKLEEVKFKIKDFDFSLSYLFKKSESAPFDMMYFCAHGRTIKTFKEEKINVNLKLLSKYQCYIFLHSSYLDSNVNQERNELNIEEEDKGEQDGQLNLDLSDVKISKEDIRKKVKEELSKLFRKEIPDFGKLQKENKKIIDEKYPYLKAKDFSDDEYGLMDEDHLITTLSNAYYKKRIKNIKDIETENNDEEKLEKIQKLDAENLFEYVAHRKRALDQLEKLLKDKEKSEEVIHKFLIGSKDKTHEKGFVEESNLWVVDDKFLSFQEYLSDYTVNKIMEETAGKIMKEPAEINQSSSSGEPSFFGGKKRPDVFLYRKSENDDPHKILVLEIKSIGKDKNNLRKVTIEQMDDYIDAFNKRYPHAEKWFYFVTGIDKEVAAGLERSDWKRLFSADDEVFYIRRETLKAYVYLYSFEALLEDSKARNSIFFQKANL